MIKRVLKKVLSKTVLKWHGYGRDGFPHDAWSDPRYEDWFHAHRTPPEELARQREEKFLVSPLFSIIVPLYKTPLNYLHDMVHSIEEQTYGEFELILVNASPERKELVSEITSYAQADTRIRILTLDRNYGITENTNKGIAIARGDFCCFCDHDDWLEPDLLHDYVVALNKNPTIDLLYCDEDLVDSNHRHLHPLFKPDFSPELLISKNYIVHLMTVRRTIIDQMPKPGKEFDGAQDYNMVLFASEQARAVHHTPKVHYHWRISETSTAAKPEAKPYSRQAYRKAIFGHTRRSHIDASITYSGIINIYNPWFQTTNKPTVTVIVRDTEGEGTLTNFLHAFEQTNDYPCEIILITSREAEVMAEFPEKQILIVPPSDNSYLSFNNATQHSHGNYLAFFDDTHIPLTAGFLGQLVGACSIQGVGAVGPKILYSDYTTCCYGIAVTNKRIMPLFRGHPEEHPGYQCNARASQNFSAVSRAGLTVSRHDFDAVNGFDPSFSCEIGSVDLCHKLLLNGLRIAAFNHVKIMTTIPKQDDIYNNRVNADDFSPEGLLLYDKKWPNSRNDGDPYFSSSLDQTSCYYQLEGENYYHK
ncbi:glycosyltransferase [Adlercreutzia sp. ZJ138]|uniref:glycosyltransferase family 2 protein n=1 Tax=Adlercreutzia sp. ZJ138 TaxID=2709405 RepID=UPI0013ECFD40|nr:glycosyltransferase [Adlercreutzia sp. ZJ138]